MLLRRLMSLKQGLPSSKKENKYDSVEIEKQVRDIRRRIEQLRSSLHSSQPEPKINSEQPTEDMESIRKKEARNKELNALREKLRKK